MGPLEINTSPQFAKVMVQTSDNTWITLHKSKISLSAEQSEPWFTGDDYLYQPAGATFSLTAVSHSVYSMITGEPINDTPIYDEMMRKTYG